MGKSLVLKRKIRLDKWQIALYVLYFAFLTWYSPLNFVGAFVCLFSFALINAHTFLKRVTLADHKISIWDENISDRVTQFDRITHCSIEEDAGEIQVELTVQQCKAPSYAIFGNHPIGALQNYSCVVRFSIEPHQLGALANYLSAHNVTINATPAREKWTVSHLAKRAHLLNERDDLSDGEAAEQLREIEGQLKALNKF